MPVKKKAVSKVSQAKTPVLSVLETPENLQLHLQEFEKNLPDDEQILWNNAIQFMNAEIMGFIYAGMAFKKLRETTEHGHFKACLAERGFKPRYVQERIQIAEKFSEVEITNFDLGAHLGISKLRKIATWEDEQVVEFFEGKEVYGFTIDDAQEMSSRDFEAQIKANKDEVTALEETLTQRDFSIHELEQENLILSDQLNSKGLTSDWPDVVNKARNESTALSEQVLMSINDIEKLLLDMQTPDVTLSELEHEVGYSSVYHNIRMIQARTQQLMQSLEESYQGEQALDANESIHTLSQSEMHHAITRRASLTSRHIQDKMEREEKREKKKGPRRGRPRVITEKDV